MAFRIEVDKKQMEELRASLKQAPQELKAGLLLRILNNAMQRVEFKMISETPMSKTGVKSKRYVSRSHAPGYLKRSIGRLTGGKDYPTVWVKPRRQIGGFDAWYSHLPMMFHKTRKSLPNNKKSMTERKTDFVRLAWNATKKAVESEVQTEVEAELKRIFKG